ncbi:sterol desaturase family protein [Geobacter argillaceus]|uniref:Sterol desaturase/sphingolipid hydroxylase (Fatty acid hydroxylase superfamily) n=1 Tax=Geobacter argillaceus TaxID=345631 RepID=A0A562V8L4_9BACT|nr:sterol desaturase family protein [Geobacter argillaceus]TWJ14067.1 sterol desaturase/sphingolipid hydroxylase (fatty acid hydroxylase superfamily) [Geobacter argillaceus]
MSLTGEQGIRLAFFFGVLTVIAVWEVVAPRRPLTDSKGRRWFTNLSLVVIDTAATRLILPILPVGMAIMAQERGWGILNTPLLPFWSRVVLAVVVLDFVIYLQHVLFHFLPIFWRLHRMHHTDLDFDVTTGNRFHPVEILVSMAIKLAAVSLLGAPAMSVLIFEVALNATSLFNHGNIRMPVSLDRWLRHAVVTPDMHRVHHSVNPRETNSNFGFNLPWWDRLCGTYCPQPERGHAGMTIGLKEFRDPTLLTLPRLLIQPFVRKPF